MSDINLSLASNCPEAHIITTLDPAQQQAFSRLVKMSGREVKAQDVHVIASQFHVCSPGGRLHVSVDLAELFDQEISFAFGLTHSTPSELCQLKGEHDVLFVQRDQGILATNGTMQCTLHPPFDPTEPKTPAIDEQHFVGVELQDICPKRLRAALGKGNYTTLKIYDGQLEQVSRNGAAPYTFQAESFFHLLDKSPELELISTYLGTGCSGTSMSLQLANCQGSYWLLTTCKLTINATLKSYELLVKP